MLIIPASAGQATLRRNLLGKWSELLYSDRTPSFKLKRPGNKVKDSALQMDWGACVSDLSVSGT